VNLRRLLLAAAVVTAVLAPAASAAPRVPVCLADELGTFNACFGGNPVVCGRILDFTFYC
jgi:hypothetical protein